MTDLGIVIVLNESHSENAEVSIDTTDFGIVMLVIPLPDNNPHFIESSDGGKLIDFRLLHLENACSPIDFTEFGIGILFNSSHPSKACAPIF